MIEDFLVNEEWRNIATGMTAFCIFGGPSTKTIANEKLQDIILNNFSVTVNNNIKFYKDISMYLTSDNKPSRKYFENDKGFFTLRQKHKNKQMNIEYNSEYIQNEDMIKILISQDHTSNNYNIDKGQIYIDHARRYAKLHKNVWIAREWADKKGYFFPHLHEKWEGCLESYGGDPQNLHAAGNMGNMTIQFLWYMGFDKVITTGFGDCGNSMGYENEKNYHGNSNFEWSNWETDCIPIHEKKWSGNRELKILKGGEILKSFGNFRDADEEDLIGNAPQKALLIKKIKDLRGIK